MQTDFGDAWLVNYFLEHSFQLLVNKDYVGGLWSPTFFYPYPKVLAFSENLFGSAPIYWLFRSFLSSDTAFQLWMIAVCVLGFASFAVLMRRYKVGNVLGALGAFLFAFSMPRIIVIGHPQLLPQFFTPLAFIILWDFVNHPTIKRLTLLFLLVYLQVLAAIYLGWFLLFSLLIFFCIIYGFYSEARIKFISYWRSNFKATIVISITWLGLMLITLFPYLEAKAILGSRHYSEVDTMLPRLSSWFSVPPNAPWSFLLAWTSKDLPMTGEHYMFAGFIMILLTGLCFYTLFYYKKALTFEKALLVKVCLFVFITIFCLSLRLPFGISLWRIVYEVVPGASVIRAVARIWTISYFYLLVAVIISVDSLLQAMINKKQLRVLIATLLCLIGISEQFLFLTDTEKTPYIKQITELNQLLNKNCDVAYLSINPKNLFYEEHLAVMWAGIKANVPVVNGYSGSFPPDYVGFSEPISTAQVSKWLEPISNSTGKKLCMIFHNSLKIQDNIISQYAIQKNISLSNEFVSYTVKLPIPKVFAQDIKFFEIAKTVEPSSEIKLPVLIKNTSNFVWSPKGLTPTNLSYRWIDANGKLAIFQGDGNRTKIPEDLAPGDISAVNTTIITPDIPGKYKLILTMVLENVGWFNEKVATSSEMNVEVISR